MILLIHPPVAKPCEPPAGIPKLSGLLNRHGIPHGVLDANIEGLSGLLRSARLPDTGPADAWTRRAFRGLDRSIAAIRDPRSYSRLDRYTRAVMDTGRVLEIVSAPSGAAVGLANYQHETLSPLRSSDLIQAAESFEQNPFYPYFRTRLRQCVSDQQPSYAGISLNFLSQALCTFAMIGFLRQEFPGLKIILGGGLVTSWLSRPGWQAPFSGLVDHLVAGPGESPLLSILGVEAPAMAPGPPSYDALPRNDYLSPGFILPYSGSSGCYWNRCTFCPEKAEGNSYVPLAPQRVTAELAALAEKNSPALVHLLDSALSPVLMEALAEAGPGLPWYGFARAGAQLTDLDFCLSLRRSGCVMLKLGLESGDQGVLDSMQKGLSLETASRTLKTLRKAGISAYVYLIFGTPAENLLEGRRTLSFVASHHDCIDFLNLALFNMPVGSLPVTGIETREFYDGDLSLYTDFTHPGGWDRKAVRHFLDHEFRKHPAVSGILKKEPPVFTSNHAPFFVMKQR